MTRPRRSGVDTIDAPVSGGDVGARNAALSIMVGGDEEPIERLRPIFETMGKSIVHQGGPGAGQHTKMVNQILIATGMIGVCEALLYGYKAGLDLDTVLESVAGGAAGSWSLTNFGPRMLAGDFAPGFFVEHFIKDMGIALGEAKRAEACATGSCARGAALRRAAGARTRPQGHAIADPRARVTLGGRLGEALAAGYESQLQISAPTWPRSTGRLQRRHVRGRRSASTSSARSRTTQTIAQGKRNEVDVVIVATHAVSDARGEELSPGPGPGAWSLEWLDVSLVFAALLACAVAALVIAEWPRISAVVGSEARARRDRARRKSQLKVVRTDRDDFAESVQRDLDQLPTIEEHEQPHR